MVFIDKWSLTEVTLFNLISVIIKVQCMASIYMVAGAGMSSQI